MPVLDKLLQLADAYAPTTAAAPATNGTYLDGVVPQDYGMGNGPDIGFLVQVHASITGTSGGTFTVRLQAATDSAFTSPVDVLIGDTITQSDFATKAVAGIQLMRRKIPRGYSYRYWRFAVTIATHDLSGGSFDAWLGDNGLFQDNVAYAGNYTP